MGILRICRKCKSTNIKIIKHVFATGQAHCCAVCQGCKTYYYVQQKFLHLATETKYSKNAEKIQGGEGQLKLF